jgi:hypothetical protein
MNTDRALEFVLQRVGERLMKLRVQKGYTSLRAFANRFDLPEIQYWRMENGKTNITLRSLTKVLHIHRLSLHEFFCLVNGDG